MASMIILGATGRVGRHVLGRALEAGHDVAVVVRDPSSLAPDVRARVQMHIGDLTKLDLPDLIGGHDVLINCAGHVAGGQGFVDLVDRVVTGAESLPAAESPVCWFLAGAALLDIDASGRRGVDLPQVGATYWPHHANFERLHRSAVVDWRLLCPGPMLDGPALGVQRLRISVDRLPIEMPATTGTASGPRLASAFASLVPQMRVSYADAAAVMLANLDRGGVMARRRVGLALPARDVTGGLEALTVAVG